MQWWHLEVSCIAASTMHSYHDLDKTQSVCVDNVRKSWCDCSAVSCMLWLIFLFNTHIIEIYQYLLLKKNLYERFICKFWWHSERNVLSKSSIVRFFIKWRQTTSMLNKNNSYPNRVLIQEKSRYLCKNWTKSLKFQPSKWDITNINDKGIYNWIGYLRNEFGA